MSLCPSCGKELSVEEANAKFCAYCGAPLAAEPVVEETKTEEAVEEAATEETTVTEEATDNQTVAENKQSIDVEEIKEKLGDAKDAAVELCDKVVEKGKTVPAIAQILEKVDKKFYPVIVAVPVVVVLLILVLIIGALTSSSYMTPVEDYIKLVNKKSTDTTKYMYVLASDEAEDYYETIIGLSEYMEESLEDSNEDLEEMFDELDDEFDSWKIGFNKKKAEKVDKDDLEDFEETFENYYENYYEDQLDEMEEVLDDEDDLEDFADNLDISEKEAKKVIKATINYFKSFEDVEITEAWEVKGKFTIKADKDEWESDTVKFTVIKVNGSWVYIGDSITFDDDDEEISFFNGIFDALESNYINAGF